MEFVHKLLPFWGKVGPALGQKYVIGAAHLPASQHNYHNGTVVTAMITPLFPMATMVYFQFSFAAITLILLVGSVMGRAHLLIYGGSLQLMGRRIPFPMGCD